MPSIPKWELAKRRYIESQYDKLDMRRIAYGFNTVKYIYAHAYALENVLNDPQGIDIAECEREIEYLKQQVEQLIEWYLLKTRDQGIQDATIADWS